MTEIQRKWLGELLIIPILVGLVVAIFQFLVPLIFKEKKEISYTIEKPIAVENLDIQVNAVKTSAIYLHKVRIWNSGKLPLNDLPLRIVFCPEGEEFFILATSHDTKPKYEFGCIQEETIDNLSKRFIFKLLNNNDEDNITFLTNKIASISVYAKIENLGVKKVEVASTQAPTTLKVAGLILAVLGSAVTVVIMVLNTLLNRRMKLARLSLLEVKTETASPLYLKEANTKKEQKTNQ